MVFVSQSFIFVSCEVQAMLGLNWTTRRLFHSYFRHLINCTVLNTFKWYFHQFQFFFLPFLKVAFDRCSSRRHLARSSLPTNVRLPAGAPVVSSCFPQSNPPMPVLSPGRWPKPLLPHIRHSSLQGVAGGENRWEEERSVGSPRVKIVSNIPNLSSSSHVPCMPPSNPNSRQLAFARAGEDTRTASAVSRGLPSQRHLLTFESCPGCHVEWAGGVPDDQPLWGRGDEFNVSETDVWTFEAESNVTREVRAKSMIVKQRDCKSLLLSLLWDIGGAPPVLIEGKVIHLRWILAFLILNGLFLSTSANSQQQWCGQSLDQQVIKMSLRKMSLGKCHLRNVT